MRQVIGKYKFVIAAGEPKMYGHTSVFGVRRTMTVIGQMMQALVFSLGEYVWLNVDASDVSLNEERS